MTSRRQVQVADEIRREIGELLLKQIKDPRVGFASVTEVQVSPDLRHAHINVSVYGSDDEREATMTALHHGSGFFRREIGTALKLRYTPTITFHLDDSLERGDRILRLLNQVKGGGTTGPLLSPPPAEEKVP
jgi:ribosome-binding factor A